jgi:branched-chain amino acid transport system substrate-binding protein
MKPFIFGAIALMLALGGYFLLQGPPEDEEPAEEIIKIGFMGPLTGDAASYGESIRRGVELAMVEANLQGVEVVFEDSQCAGPTAVSAINKLITVNNVVAVVGEVCSGASLAAAPVAEQNGVVMISPASTSPEITNAGDYIFRVAPSDALQGAFGAELVYNNNHKTLAILYSNEEYGVGFEEVLRTRYEELGGEVVASEPFSTEATDVRTELAKIKAKKPDALYIISNAPSLAAAALKEARELGITAARYGSEGLKSPDILESAGESAEGLVVTSVSSGTSDFIAKHNAAYGIDPGPFSAQGYDAFRALVLALDRGARTGAEIKDALYAITFEGASGAISFDENGDVSGIYEILVVENGAFKPVVQEEDIMMMEDGDHMDGDTMMGGLEE